MALKRILTLILTLTVIFPNEDRSNIPDRVRVRVGVGVRVRDRVRVRVSVGVRVRVRRSLRV